MKVAVTTLAFCVAALLALGLVMLYSATMTTSAGAHDLMMQLVWCVLGFALCVTATVLDYQLLKKLVWPAFGCAFFLLAMVFAPLVGVIGAMQAAEALKVIAGVGQALTGRLLMHDALRAEWNSMRVARQTDCLVCGTRHAAQAAP